MVIIDVAMDTQLLFILFQLTGYLGSWKVIMEIICWLENRPSADISTPATFQYYGLK